jgi:hypothetical protein
MARDLFDEVHEEDAKIHQDLRDSASTPPLNESAAVLASTAGTEREASPERTTIGLADGQAAIQRPALPPPETHAFSQKAWQKAHPNGNLKTAIKQAKAKGYRVID